jgi:PAS domain S-box-containing protein
VTALLIAVIVRQGSGSGKGMGEEKGSEVGFVVDTFQDLVGKLKEKERELEKLKAVAEEKAGSIEAYNENILQSVPSGVVSIDNEMVIKSINRAASEILGAEIKAVIGKRPKEVFNEPLAELMSAGDALSRGEYRYVTSDNRHVWLGITTSTLRNMGGEQIGRIFVFSDLTGIKALQDQLELRQRLSQLGEMSAGIAHEMRNSMAVISGYVKLAAKKGGEEVQSAVEPIAEEIKNQGKS